MSDHCSAEPLYSLLERIRRPVTLRESIAVCLRHIYVGDPLSGNDGGFPAPPASLMTDVSAEEVYCDGVRCLVYKPKVVPGAGIILYTHGGGFVIGSPEDTDYTARLLCHGNQSSVISIDYGLAPERVFPFALEECAQVYRFAIEHSEELVIDTSKVVLAGDSAGGNLAAALALRLRDAERPPDALIMLAPWLDMHLESYDSYNRLAPDGVVFDAAFMGYARGAYARFEDWKNPLASPIFCNPNELPPTLIIAGSDDPLVDQSKRFYEIAREKGAAHVQLIVYDGMPHCFYSFPSLFDQERDCYEQISRFLKQ